MSPFARPPVVMGHRGAPRRAPENTPVSFHAAWQDGASWVELDVRLSADGVLLCHHDPVDGQGRPLIEQDSSDLAAHGVWTFEAVLAALPDGLGVDVEVKNVPGEPDFDETHRVAAELARVLDDAPRRPWLMTSFHPGSVERFLADSDEHPAGLLLVPGSALATCVAAALGVGASVACVHDRTPDLAADGIAAAHDAGIALLVWTVDDPERARELAEAGVDAICTNDPAAISAALTGR